ncbi:hypothetical protein TeGR_g7658, partial [Tetraparma gracilis]
EEEGAGGKKAARDLNSDMKAVKKLAKGFGKELGWLLNGDDGSNPGSWVGVEVDGARDWQSYLNRYADLQESLGVTNVAGAEQHWKDYGQAEGRDCTRPETSERVVKIDWSGQNLSGILDGRLLRRLDGLRELDVHNNGIAGIIPVQLEEMEKLEVLRVYQNRLEGPLKMKKLVDMRVCDVVRSDNKMIDGNSFTSDGCPQRFVAQMERHRVRVCAREMGMDGLKLEDGKGPDGAWKGVWWDAEGCWVIGINWSGCELKGDVADEMKHFQRLEWAVLLDNPQLTTVHLPKMLRKAKLRESGTPFWLYDNPRDERTLLMSAAVKLSKSPVWLLDGAGMSKLKWKGVKLDAEGWVVGIDWSECGLKEAVPDALGLLTRLEYVFLCGNPHLNTENLPKKLGTVALVSEGTAVWGSGAIGDKGLLIEAATRLGKDLAWLQNGNGEDIAKWRGINVDSSLRITRIDWQNQGLSGTIPEALGGLQSLAILHLHGRGTQVSGLRRPLPSSLKSLQNLTTMYVPSDFFNGIRAADRSQVQAMLEMGCSR